MRLYAAVVGLVSISIASAWLSLPGFKATTRPTAVNEKGLPSAKVTAVCSEGTAVEPESSSAPLTSSSSQLPFWFARFVMAIAPAPLVLGMGGALVPSLVEPVAPVHAQADSEFKIQKGAASTLNTGTVKTMTRGVNIENANFEGKDLTGVSFQQSLVRNGNFRKAKLLSASFFDADCTDADFTGADMSQVNLELSNLFRANFDQAIVNEAYISGSTKLTDVSIDGADFTDTLLRKDQQSYLCKRATGVNKKTGVATKDSLLCP